MSNLKIKIAYEDDIRIFKADPDSKELLNKIVLFVKETHNISTFRLVYKDNENDEITVGDENDLKDALCSNNDSKMPKLYVKKISKETSVTSSSSDENSTDEEIIYNGRKGWGVIFGGFNKHRHHRGCHRGDRKRHRSHKHHGHHKHHRGDHKRHGHHGHKRHGFGKFTRCDKDKDLRIDVICESLNKNCVVNGNSYIIKTWKLKNVGKKAIPPNCNIEYFGHRFNLMVDGNKFLLKNKEININEEFEVSIVVKSPKENGKYKSKWKLITSEGKKFGKPLLVSFIVNDNNNNRLFKKEKKLLCKKEKLLKKLQKLEEESNKLNNNNDDKDDIKEEIIEGNETQNSINGENEIIIDENYQNVEDDDEDDEDKFIYCFELKELQNMGFNDENKLKQLLKANNGSIESVLNNLF